MFLGSTNNQLSSVFVMLGKIANLDASTKFPLKQYNQLYLLKFFQNTGLQLTL